MRLLQEIELLIDTIMGDSMKIYADNKPKNCNYCKFKQIMSQHWDLEDYCLLNKKCISKINMEVDCPIEEVDHPLKRSPKRCPKRIKG